MPAAVSFANGVPFSLLLGPAAPSSQAGLDVDKRYTIEHFLRLAPAYVTLPSNQKVLFKVLGGKEGGKAASDMLSKATQEIKEAKRKESIAIGYFEQGILVGLGIYGIPLLTCIGASLFFGVRAGLRKFAFI